MNEETSFEAFAQEFEMKVIKQIKFELICSAVIPAISCLVAVERVIDTSTHEVKFDLHFFYWHAYLQQDSKPDENQYARLYTTRFYDTNKNQVKFDQTNSKQVRLSFESSNLVVFLQVQGSMFGRPALISIEGEPHEAEGSSDLCLHAVALRGEECAHRFLQMPPNSLVFSGLLGQAQQQTPHLRPD